jgi:hypothetical protein
MDGAELRGPGDEIAKIRKATARAAPHCKVASSRYTPKKIKT